MMQQLRGKQHVALGFRVSLELDLPGGPFGGPLPAPGPFPGGFAAGFLGGSFFSSSLGFAF